MHRSFASLKMTTLCREICGKSHFFARIQAADFQGVTTMRFLRPFVFAIVLASAFFYFTTYRNGRFHPPNWISRPHHVEITEAAGSEPFDAEEQNNIRVYGKNIGAVVNLSLIHISEPTRL